MKTWIKQKTFSLLRYFGLNLTSEAVYPGKMSIRNTRAKIKSLQKLNHNCTASSVVNVNSITQGLSESFLFLVIL